MSEINRVVSASRVFNSLAEAKGASRKGAAYGGFFNRLSSTENLFAIISNNSSKTPLKQALHSLASVMLEFCQQIDLVPAQM